MPDQDRPLVSDAIQFGPFRLFPTQRLLLKGDKPTRTGSRALEILIHLVEKAGEIVGKDELIARVWPSTIVEETNLRVHIAALRKALGDSEAAARYITTVPGRGYCFVAPVNPPQHSGLPPDDEEQPDHNLGVAPVVVGRDETLDLLAAHLQEHRFATIVGPGGIGKTTVAVAVAHKLLGSYPDGVRFVDLTPLRDHHLVPNVLAVVLGLTVHSEDVLTVVANFLRRKQMLLILDNCEHVIETAAILAEKIIRESPNLHILATSREPLRVDGEHVQRISPLTVPPTSEGLSAAEALSYSAVRLFCDRAAASLEGFVMTDSDAPVVTEICRRLDGIALAIELAAVRVEALGLRGLASLLNDRFKLLAAGRRTALQRHQTLGAALDWSYELLPEPERMIFRRLAVFVGDFVPEAASAVAAGAGISESDALDLIVGLVEKSLVVADIGGDVVRYRLLETTRAYALEKLIENGEFDAASARHAEFYNTLFARLSANGGLRTSAESLANARAALKWCFDANRDIATGIELATAVAPTFLAMSLLRECNHWSERALAALDERQRNGAVEMHLHAAIGLSLMFTPGSIEVARAALRRSLATAEERGDVVNQLKLLAPLQMLHVRLGEFKTALRYARRSVAVAAVNDDPAAKALADSLLGNALHFTGQLQEAREALDSALQTPRDLRAAKIYLGFDHHNRASMTLARTLWLQGYPDQAIARANRTIADAAQMQQPVTVYLARIWAVPLYMWVGDMDSAEACADEFLTHAETHSLGPYIALGRGFRGMFAVHRTEAKQGVEDLAACLEEVQAVRYGPLTTPFKIALAHGFSRLGRLSEAISAIDETIELVKANGDLFYVPELLRVKAAHLLSQPSPSVNEAESCLQDSLDLSRKQCARAWELRTAATLAAHWMKHDRGKEAGALLRPVFARFEEGHGTADLRAAAQLIAALPSGS